MKNTSEIQSIEVRLRATTKRGAAIRLRLLNSTANLLSGYGYSATTIQLLSETTNISRGSILHQFPTRLDLIAATLDFILEGMMQSSRDTISKIKDPKQCLEAYADVIWDLIGQEPGAAVSEILHAARWDSELSDRVKSEAEKFESELDADILKIAHQAGVKNPKEILPQIMLLAITARGFTREFSFQASGPATHKVISASKSNYIRFIRGLSYNI